MNVKKKAVVLCSGGVDSACAAVLSLQEGFEVFGLHFQRPRKDFERAYAQKLALKYSFPLKIITCDLTQLIREAQENSLKYETQDGKIWEFLLGRNFMYLTLAANYAVSIGAETITVGFAPHDAPLNHKPWFADYPDCHKTILTQFGSLLSDCLHYKLTPSVSSLRIWAPLFSRVESKVDVFRLALSLGIDLDDTITCYTPIRKETAPDTFEWVPCGTCLACVHKKQALDQLEQEDLE